MNHIELLSRRLREQGWSKRGLSLHMGWHADKIHRWSTGEHNAWVADVERCWQEIGHTLLPVRVPYIKPRLTVGDNPKKFQAKYQDTHKIIHMLFSEIEERRLVKKAVFDAAGVPDRECRRWAKQPQGGGIECVEACFNVMGMSLLPFPISTLGAIHAAA